MKKEEKKRNLFGKEYLMASAVALSLLAGANKTQTVKADTVNNNTDTAAKTTAVAATANTNATTNNGQTTGTTANNGQTATGTTTNNGQTAGTTTNNGQTAGTTTNNGQTTTGTTTNNGQTAGTTTNNGQTTTGTTTNNGQTTTGTTTNNGQTTGTPDPTNPGSTGTTTGTDTGAKSTGNTTNNPGSASDNTQTHPGSTTGKTTSDETSANGKENVSEDVSNENIGQGSVLYSYLNTQTAKDNFAKLNDTAKKVLSAAIREGSTVTLDSLTDKQITALNKIVLTKTEDSQYTLKDYDSITNKIVNRESSSQIPFFKGDEIVNMPGLEQVKDAETGETATMDIWDSWPVQDPETGYVENWNGYQLVVAMMGIPHKSDSHLYLLYNKYGDNNVANWKVAGSIFGYNNDPKTGQWSGSAMLNSDGSIQLFYANVVSEESNNQRVATATIYLDHDNDTVSINRVENDKILFIGDGTVYQNYEQWKNSKNRNANNPQMRDGHVFKDSDGNYYLAFETATGDNGTDPEDDTNMYEWGRYGGNAAYNVSELFKLVNSDDMSTRAAVSNSAIGLLKLDMSDTKDPKVAVDSDGKQVLYKPMVKTVLSGDEIERPDLIKLNGKYYLFVDARVNHASDTDLAVKTNIAVGDNVTMLGFVSDKVDGEYIPLNGDGLVLGASVPSTWRTATYSYYVVKINPANLKSDKITINGVSYDKDYFANHVVLINAYMGNRGEVAGKGKNATLGPSFLVLIDGNKTQVLANSVTDQGVWDWNENSPKLSLAASSLKEAKASTDTFSYQVNKDGHWYLYADNTSDGTIKMQTGFQYIADQNKTVYYDSVTGQMEFGWQKIDGKTYYFNITSGGKAVGQAYIDGYWYLFDQDGVMQTGFQKIANQNKTVYYDSATGRMQYGFQKVNGKTYYLNPVSGGVTYGQVKINGHWYLFDSKTGAMKTGFQRIASQNKTVYYDSATGRMKYGFQKVNGKTYYLNPVSGGVTYGQVKINGHWYLFDSKTGAMKTGFQRMASQKKTVYYDPKTGQMVYGFRKINGKWYLFHHKSGSKETFENIGNYLYLKSNAALYNVKGKRAQASTYKKGKYIKAVGVRVIKGKAYYKLANGKYIKAGNVTVGKKRTLKKNAYVYTKKGKKLVHAKKALKKGTKKVTYGSVVVFKGKKYYAVAKSQYIKSGNFK